MSIMDLGGTIEITAAAYSNALLVAVLPYVSDFAARLQLELPLPVTTNHVQAFGLWRTDIGGGLALTNGMRFSFGNGHIDGFASAFYQEQVMRHILPTNEQVRITQAQAVSVVRKAIEALGYDADLLYTDLDLLMIEEPVRVRGRMYARYQMEWVEPQWREKNLSVRAMVNGDSGRIEGLWLHNVMLCRPPPPLAVQPTIRPYRPTLRTEKFSDGEKAQLLAKLLPEVDSLAAKMGLPIPRPLAPSQVEELIGWRFGGEIDKVTILLTNHYRFSTVHGGRVSGFWAPDAFFGNRGVRVREFFGLQPIAPWSQDPWVPVEFPVVGGQTYHVALDDIGETLVVGCTLRLTAERGRWQPPTLDSAGGLHLTLQVYSSSRHVTEASADLQTWMPIATNIAANGAIVIDLPQATNPPVQFLRSRPLN